MNYPDKRALLEQGKELMARFCAANDLPVPQVVEADTDGWPFGVCAYYRRDLRTINVKACASIGVAGMAWPYPVVALKANLIGHYRPLGMDHDCVGGLLLRREGLFEVVFLHIHACRPALAIGFALERRIPDPLARAKLLDKAMRAVVAFFDVENVIHRLRLSAVQR